LFLVDFRELNESKTIFINYEYIKSDNFISIKY